MNTLNWITNRHVLSALCAAPMLFSYAYTSAEETAVAPAEAAPAYTITYNLGIVTNYVSRGVNLSDGPAIQGGVDWAHSNGFYLGAWASTVNPLVLGAGTVELPKAPNGADLGTGNHVETDWYGGYTHAFGPVTLGVGGNYVWYPEGEKSYHDRNQDTFEGNVNISAYGFTYTFYHAFTDWYGIGNTRREAATSPGSPSAANSLADTSGVEYHELKYNATLPFAGLNLATKVGYQRSSDICLNQKDFLIGLSRSFSFPTGGKPIDGFTAGANYTDTFGEESCSKAGLYYTDDHFKPTNEQQLSFFIKRSW